LQNENDSKGNELILKKCLAEFESLSPNWKYVVSPKFNDFEFNSFIHRNHPEADVNWMKDSTLKKLSWSNIDFQKVQTEVNQKFSAKYDFDLTELSNSELSNSVITFSGIHENLVFMEIVDYCNAVKPSDLTKDFFNKSHNYSSSSSYNLVIDKDKIEIIVGNGVTLELQCDETDIIIENYR
tara:strand:- start:923 stop:1468 length:546 start_codon:yes stop_codon:yes gene_type:complete